MGQIGAMRRALVVEDDPDLCDTLALFMESLGIECLKALSFHDVKKMNLENLDVAVLDVNLGPEQPNGLDVFLYLKRRLGHFRVVFLTGHKGSHPLVQEVTKLEGTTVLEKPVDIEEFGRIMTGRDHIEW